jgi:phosphatidylglycerophosphate synthase
MGAADFTGDTKEPMVSPLAKLERRFIEAHVDRIPSWLQTYHLTLLTLLWTGLLVLSGWLAGRGNLQWLWLSSAMLALQWLTDAFDGAVGRRRNTGLKRWGFFMDHFLDYVFMACVTGHYAFLVAEPTRTLFLLLIPLYTAFEVNSWLEYGATGRFRITYNGLGPTEVRIFFVVLNTAIIVFGTRFLEVALPWFETLLLVLLVVTVATTQRRIWALDMAEKAEPPSAGGR